MYYDAIDDLRVALRWMARDLENEEMRAQSENPVVFILPFPALCAQFG